MQDNFEASLQFVTSPEIEGGWSNDPRDPGGTTMRGITLQTYRSFYGKGKTKADLKAISQAELSHIYRVGYWDTCKCDSLPVGVDLVIFDFGVNAGPGRSVRLLQHVVGTGEDGVIGPKTRDAIQEHGVIRTVRSFSQARLEYYQGLTQWSLYGRGWSRRVRLCEYEAYAMLEKLL